MSRILLAYSTVDGHTLHICQQVKSIIEQSAHQVTLVPLADALTLDVAAFDTIILGASIRYGKHNPVVYQFIKRYRAVLDARPNAFFSVNLVARKPTKANAETNPYVRKFLRQTGWQPGHVAVFAGKLAYPQYRWLDRQIIRLIMWMTKGPTDPQTVREFTDWQQVEAFARQVSRL